MGFVVDKVALGQVFHPVLWFSLFIIIPPKFHSHLHLHAAFTTGRQTGETWEPPKDQCSYGNWGALDM
jgi:hypothetical protein